MRRFLLRRVIYGFVVHVDVEIDVYVDVVGLFERIRLAGLAFEVAFHAELKTYQFRVIRLRGYLLCEKFVPYIFLPSLSISTRTSFDLLEEFEKHIIAH